MSRTARSNDRFRKTFSEGEVTFTQRVTSMLVEKIHAVVNIVWSFYEARLMVFRMIGEATKSRGLEPFKTTNNEFSTNLNIKQIYVL